MLLTLVLVAGRRLMRGWCRETNITAMRLGPGKHLKGRTLMGGVVTPEEFDYFHEVSTSRLSRRGPSLTHAVAGPQLIINFELARCGTRGYMDGLVAGTIIGLPPVLNFGSPAVQAAVVPDVLAGRKFICLAISEAFAGSDVGGLQTEARREGDEWVITGTKKCVAVLFSFIHSLRVRRSTLLSLLLCLCSWRGRWITNGTFADYFTVGCKTETGFTVILVPRDAPGALSTKPIKTAYSSTAGTAYVTFDGVRVPVGNTLGREGGGLQVMLSNFNHERWMIVSMSLRMQRLVVEECLL